MIYDETDMVRDGRKLYGGFTLTLLCQVDRAHVIGRAIKLIAGHALDIDGILLANGLKWDEAGKAVADCKKCARLDPITRPGRDQRVSRQRLLDKFDTMQNESRHADTLQV